MGNVQLQHMIMLGDFIVEIEIEEFTITTFIVILKDLLFKLLVLFDDTIQIFRWCR